MVTKEKIKRLPLSPGVYIMKGAEGKVLYVGKAINLRKRVASYFRPKASLDGRIEAMVRLVEDIDYISTSTEAEALIYENGLIKQLSPRYNIALKDGKSYPMLKLTMGEDFPRLIVTREKKNDGSAYYGPYANAKLLRQALVFLKQIFRLRSCVKLKNKACLEYHINQCLGPCVGGIERSGYSEIVKELKLFLEGRRKELLNIISSKMKEAAAREDFEAASGFKDRLEALSTIKEDSIMYKPSGDLEELGRMLGMAKTPEIIEAFDVSNIMGEAAVGSMISFYKGRPRKSEYRHFKIKTVSGIDDYAMMREIVGRRYYRIIREGKDLPDLILIDGGKGHLGAACGELENLGITKVPVVGIAKEFEKLYVKDRKDPILLPKESKALHLLQRMRDEAHRFAISYHKHLMSKRYR